MTTRPAKSIVRLPRRAARHAGDIDVDAMIREQSVRNAAIAGAVVIAVFSILWAMLSTLVGRIFPWMTILLGVLVGLVVRRAGRGFDWRFAALAAAFALVGALAANIVVAAAFTAEELGASTVEVLRAVTSMTWPVFFGEALSAADLVYALMAAVLAAYYSNRRLTRSEYNALRKWREDGANARQD